MALPSFIQAAYHIPDYLLDLLELAAFTYVADRLAVRGPRDAVEYHAWPRSFDFHMAVRVADLWNQDEIKADLRDALTWLTGDLAYSHTFYQGHRTPPTGLFDTSAYTVQLPSGGLAVLPFSGGLDSLTGALWLLESTPRHVCLVSHQSQSKTKRTQIALADALQNRYPGRLSHYRFECSLTGKRAPEESQRSRSFMYCAIAFAIAKAHDQDSMYVFENGITGLNFGRRQDMLNARSSRTTHPQTLGRLARLFSKLGGAPFTIEAPFLWDTKRDIIERLVRVGGEDLISSAVSCTRTLQYTGTAPQCGECFQCIDRRFAAFAAKLNDIDFAGLYHTDIVSQAATNPEARTTVVDYVRQACDFAKLDPDAFHDRYLSDLADVVDWLAVGGSDLERIEAIISLSQRHGTNVQVALREMQLGRDPYDPPEEGSLLQLVQAGEHTKPEVVRLVASVTDILRKAVPLMFRHSPPDNEPDFNRKIGALLQTHYDKLRSEHPLPRFACAGVVADHELEGADLIIESKYIRKNTSPSKASDGVIVDLVKYPPESHVLAVVLDLDRAIPDDSVFAHDIQRRRTGCTVLILR